MGSFVVSYTTRIKKMVVWKTTFVSEHLNTNQSQSTKCFALVVCFACCSLGDSSCSGARHRCRSKQIFGMQRIFAQNFPNLPKKLSCNFCRPFLWRDLQKMVFTCFSANLGCHFSKSNNVGHHFCQIFRILFGFSGILPKFSGFSTNKNVCGCACTPCNPARAVF